MRVPEEETKRRIEEFKDAFRRSRVKLTHQRLEIFREIAQTAEHPSAEVVYQRVLSRMPTVSRDTVYRTLWQLINLGLVTTLGMPRGSMRFDANGKRHHHFLCTRCGRAIDFYEAGYDHLAGPQEVRALGEVESSHVELRGTCSACLRGEGQSERQDEQ